MCPTVHRCQQTQHSATPRFPVQLELPVAQALNIVYHKVRHDPVRCTAVVCGHRQCRLHRLQAKGVKWGKSNGSSSTCQPLLACLILTL